MICRHHTVWSKAWRSIFSPTAKAWFSLFSFMSWIGLTLPLWKTENCLTGSHLSNIASTWETEYGPSSQFFSTASLTVIPNNSSACSSVCSGDATFPRRSGLRNFASCISCYLLNKSGFKSVLKIPDGAAYPVSLNPSRSSRCSCVSSQLMCVASFSSSKSFLPSKHWPPYHAYANPVHRFSTLSPIPSKVVAFESVALSFPLAQCLNSWKGIWWDSLASSVIHQMASVLRDSQPRPCQKFLVRQWWWSTGQ